MSIVVSDSSAILVVSPLVMGLIQDLWFPEFTLPVERNQIVEKDAALVS